MAAPSPAVVNWQRNLSDDPMRRQLLALLGISDVVALNPVGNRRLGVFRPHEPQQGAALSDRHDLFESCQPKASGLQSCATMAGIHSTNAIMMSPVIRNQKGREKTKWPGLTEPFEAFDYSFSPSLRE